MYVSGECVLSWMAGDQEEWRVVFEASVEPRSHNICKTVLDTAIQQQYNSSTAGAAQRQPCSKLAALCESRCTCVVGAKQQGAI